MGHVDIVANGTIEKVYKKSDGYCYDIHHGYVSVFREASNGVFKIGNVPERTETDIPENKINHTGIF